MVSETMPSLRLTFLCSHNANNLTASFSSDSTGEGITNTKVLTLSGAAQAAGTVKVYDG